MVRSSKKSRGPIVLAVAAVMAAIVVPIVLVGPEPDREPAETPAPRVEVAAGQIRTVPELPGERKNALVGELGEALEELYARAFVVPGPEATAPPSPQPTPATRVDGFFTSKARAALRKDPDVFRAVDAVRVSGGKLSFGGIVTLEGSRPVQALLQIGFDAEGRPSGRATPTVHLRQEGRLLLVSTSNGWRVDGFELRFSSRPVEPSPPARSG